MDYATFTIITFVIATTVIAIIARSLFLNNWDILKIKSLSYITTVSAV